MERKRNVEIRQQLGLKETVIDRVRKRRLTWFGHVTRMDGRWKQITTQSSPLLYPRKQKQRTAKEKVD